MNRKYNECKKNYFELSKMQNGGNRSKTIYLIRHGETQYNVEKRSQGAEVNIGLNNNGIKQAKLVGTYLADHRQNDVMFDAIYSSPLLRASETAEIIREQLKFENEIIELPELIEHKSGIVSGTTKAERLSNPKFKKFMELQEIASKIKDPIDLDDVYVEIDSEIIELGGDSNEQALQRAQKAMEQIIKEPYKKIIIVTHSGTIQHILSWITNMADPCQGNMENGTNCSVCCIKYFDNKFKVISSPNTLYIGFTESKDVKSESDTISDSSA